MLSRTQNFVRRPGPSKDAEGIGAVKQTSMRNGPAEDAADTLITASRALIGIAIRAVHHSPADITLPQHRLMVLLAAEGAQSVGALAEQLGINQSNASRLCARLEKINLVSRERSTRDGRAVDVALTDAGERVLEAVRQERHREVDRVLAGMTDRQVRSAVRALAAFSAAAHELPDQDWAVHAV